MKESLRMVSFGGDPDNFNLRREAQPYDGTASIAGAKLKRAAAQSGFP
jgi:hypothetical protein